MKRRRLILVLLLTAARAALADAPDQVLVTYQAAVGDRQISGASHSMRWNATQLAGDGAQVQVRVPVDSFDSGHAQFDALVRAALQSDRHPFAELRGVVRGGRFAGTLALRGLPRWLEMPVTVVHVGNQVVVEASFAIDLEQFGISLPAVASRVSVDVVARVSANPAAVLAGGAINPN